MNLDRIRHSKERRERTDCQEDPVLPAHKDLLDLLVTLVFQVRRDREACMVMMVYLVVKDQTVSQETVDLQEMSVWMDSPVLGVYLVYKVTLVCQAKPCPPAS